MCVYTIVVSIKWGGLKKKKRNWMELNHHPSAWKYYALTNPGFFCMEIYIVPLVVARSMLWEQNWDDSLRKPRGKFMPIFSFLGSFHLGEPLPDVIFLLWDMY